jgi:hypothetical protein
MGPLLSLTKLLVADWAIALLPNDAASNRTTR